jgi:hypothetical protein
MAHHVTNTETKPYLVSEEDFGRLDRFVAETIFFSNLFLDTHMIDDTGYRHYICQCPGAFVQITHSLCAQLAIADAA